MRDKEHVAIVRPDDNILILDQLRYKDEIRDTDEINVPAKSDYSKKELDLALSLIDDLTEKFDIADYKDAYSDELWKVIKAKAKGELKHVKEPKEDLKPTNVSDILEMLKQSLEENEKGRGRHAHAR